MMSCRRRSAWVPNALATLVLLIASVHFCSGFLPADLPFDSALSYYYIACYNDGIPHEMALLRDSSAMSTALCASLAKQGSFRYFGLQAGTQCYAGSIVGRYNKSSNAQKCSVPCSGDPPAICGGNLANSVYGFATPYSFVGCFPDGTPRDLPVLVAESQRMTVEKCAIATRRGYTYFGLQNGTKCFAGNSKGKYGDGTNGDLCNVPCSGDQLGTCGGSNANSIYTYGLSFDEVDCFADAFPRDMKLLGSDFAMTHAECAELARKNGFQHFGLQLGMYCYAGNSFGKYGKSTQCTTTCFGDPSSICGGPNANTVFSLDYCTTRGGHFDPRSVMKFTNLLPNPLLPAARYTKCADGKYRVGVTQGTQSIVGLTTVGTFPSAKMFMYYDKCANAAPTFPGRTFWFTNGATEQIIWTNELVNASGAPIPFFLHVIEDMAPGLKQTGPVRLVTHSHGLVSPASIDGTPAQWFTPGRAETGPCFVTNEYTYQIHQPAFTSFYHDHAEGVTRLNVYAGLQGGMIVTDPVGSGDDGTYQNKYGLPAGVYDILLVLGEKLFCNNGDLYYPPFPDTESFGNVILVNGVAWPRAPIEPRKYRLRWLNGAGARMFDISFSVSPAGACNPQFVVIGTDGGLRRTAAAPVSSMFIGNAERYDTIVDFSTCPLNTQITVVNTGKVPAGRDGVPPNPDLEGLVMRFDVATPRNTYVYERTIMPQLDSRPRSFPIPASDYASWPVRDLIVAELPPLQLGPASLGIRRWRDNVTEIVPVNGREIWRIINLSPDTHPMHIHNTIAYTLSVDSYDPNVLVVNPDTFATDVKTLKLTQKTGPLPHEEGPKDTIKLPPTSVLTLLMEFQDQPGTVVWHCHMLDHEEFEMMRPLQIGYTANNCYQK